MHSLNAFGGNTSVALHADPTPRRDVGSVALVHDYLTQRGGAERVVASMRAAFPGAPLYTSLFEPEGTFPVFGESEIKTLAVNKVGLFRRHHRLAFPVLAPTFSHLTVDAEVTLCSSSGWAHAAHTTGRKVVYCHTPARWLYQTATYLGEHGSGSKKWAIRAFGSGLRMWDRHVAQTADRYLVNSNAVRTRVKETYGIEAEVLPPCVTIGRDDPQTPLEGVAPGFWLCVSRFLPYKNIDAIVDAFAEMPGEQLVLVGSGPQREHILSHAPSNVFVAGQVDDSCLAWLYANCQALVAASFEDFGLTPLEANVFGKPVAVLGWGGHLDTLQDGITGYFFDSPTPAAIRRAVHRVASTDWSEEAIMAHARNFDQNQFVRRLREVIEEERLLAA
jgi:glycosyltransferase involved in cell wall biosynthesis